MIKCNLCGKQLPHLTKCSCNKPKIFKTRGKKVYPKKPKRSYVYTSKKEVTE